MSITISRTTITTKTRCWLSWKSEHSAKKKLSYASDCDRKGCAVAAVAREGGAVATRARAHVTERNETVNEIETVIVNTIAAIYALVNVAVIVTSRGTGLATATELETVSSSVARRSDVLEVLTAITVVLVPSQSDASENLRIDAIEISRNGANASLRKGAIEISRNGANASLRKGAIELSRSGAKESLRIDAIEIS